MIVTKKEKRKPIPWDREPLLSQPEAEALYVALAVERERYHGVPLENRSPDMEIRESAFTRLWVRIFSMKYPPAPASGRKEELLTESEWKMVVVAARLELDRLSKLPMALWTPGHRALDQAQVKIMKFLFP